METNKISPVQESAPDQQRLLDEAIEGLQSSNLSPKIRNYLLSILLVGGSAVAGNTQCTAEVLGADNTVEVGDSIVYTVPGTDTFLRGANPGSDDTELYIDGVAQSYGNITVNAGQEVKFKGMLVGSDYIQTFGASIGYPICNEDRTGSVQVIGAQPTPINWINVDAKQVQDSVFVIGQSAQRKNTDFTELEASGDGRDFEQTGVVIDHENPNSDASETFKFAVHVKDLINQVGQGDGVFYFRLNNHDLDSANDLSPIVSLKVEGGEYAVSMVYPNPVMDYLTVVDGVEGTPVGTVEVVDMQNNLLMRVNDLESGDGIDMNGLVPGLYIVRSTNGGFAKLVNKL